jgi:hypothetical protein
MAVPKAHLKRPAGAIAALAAALLAVLAIGGTAEAAIVPTVPLGTTANFSVLGASTVTNTGPTVLAASVGLSPGSSVTGFPPGLVLAPGTIEAATPAADQAQSDLGIAYVNAAGRSIDTTTTAELGNQTLGAGVWAASGNGALGLTGPLVLDGAGDPTSVFIFQTDSTLTTASASSVTLINGAQECNVFWQVGSSATLGTGSTFRGNILAQASVTVTTAVTVHGRALARTGAITLDTDTFVEPTCDLTPPTTTTTTSGVASTAPSTAPDDALTQDVPVDEDLTSTAVRQPSQDTSRLANTGVPVGLLAGAASGMVIVGYTALRFSRKGS